MVMITTNENREFKLIQDSSPKKLLLYKIEDINTHIMIAEADFFFCPSSDRTALLSGLKIYCRLYAGMQFMMQSLKIYMEEQNSRFFAFVPNTDIALLTSEKSSFQSIPDSFIMLQNTKNMYSNSPPSLPDISCHLDVLIGDTNETKEIFITEADMICQLLKETYWGKEYSPEMIRNRIQAAAAVVGLKTKNQYIGFVRLLSNGSLGFISDMVIHEKYRGNNYGEHLFKKLMDLPVYHQVPIMLLTAPEKGSGKESAPHIYSKYGFKKVEHEQDLTLNGLTLIYLWNKSNSKVPNSNVC